MDALVEIDQKYGDGAASTMAERVPARTNRRAPLGRPSRAGEDRVTGPAVVGVLIGRTPQSATACTGAMRPPLWPREVSPSFFPPERMSTRTCWPRWSTSATQLWSPAGAMSIPIITVRRIGRAGKPDGRRHGPGHRRDRRRPLRSRRRGSGCWECVGARSSSP